MKQLKLEVTKRYIKGSRNVARLRKQHKIPAVIYGPSGSQALCIDEKKLKLIIRKSTGSASLVEITDETGKKYLSILQSVQRNSVTNSFIHIDFLEIFENQLITVSVPIRLKGESIGVKNQGGLLEFNTHNLSIKCLPKDLPGYIEIDISNLNIGENIHVRDIPLIKGISYINDFDTVIASCSELSSTKSAEMSTRTDEETVESKK